VPNQGFGDHNLVIQSVTFLVPSGQLNAKDHKEKAIDLIGLLIKVKELCLIRVKRHEQLHPYRLETQNRRLPFKAILIPSQALHNSQSQAILPHPF
jgi:hypothetical protein